MSPTMTLIRHTSHQDVRTPSPAGPSPTAMPRTVTPPAVVAADTVIRTEAQQLIEAKHPPRHTAAPRKAAAPIQAASVETAPVKTEPAVPTPLTAAVPTPLTAAVPTPLTAAVPTPLTAARAVTRARTAAAPKPGPRRNTTAPATPARQRSQQKSQHKSQRRPVMSVTDFAQLRHDAPAPACPTPDKMAYEHQRVAESKMISVWRRNHSSGHLPSRVYACPCGYWHLTSQALTEVPVQYQIIVIDEHNCDVQNGTPIDPRTGRAVVSVDDSARDSAQNPTQAATGAAPGRTPATDCDEDSAQVPDGTAESTAGNTADTATNATVHGTTNSAEDRARIAAMLEIYRHSITPLARHRERQRTKEWLRRQSGQKSSMKPTRRAKR